MQQLRELLEEAIDLLPIYPRGKKKERITALIQQTSNLLKALDETPSPYVPPFRCKLKDERKGTIVKITLPPILAGDPPFDVFFTPNEFPNGKLGELFIKTSSEGSFASGMTDAFAVAISIMIQVGIPLEYLVAKFINTRFEPDGITGRSDIPFAKSVPDFIFRWLGRKYLDPEVASKLGLWKEGEYTSSSDVVDTKEEIALPCNHCGSQMIPSGTCYRCGNCGSTSGCS